MATACLTSSKSGKSKNKNIHAYKGALKKITFRKFIAMNSRTTFFTQLLRIDSLMIIIEFIENH